MEHQNQFEKQLILNLWYLGSNSKEYLNQLKGKMTAKVISSSELTKDQIKKIENTLSESFSKKIDIDIEIDEKILGGLVVKIGSKMIDSSLLTRLKLMQSNMNEV